MNVTFYYRHVDQVVQGVECRVMHIVLRIHYRPNHSCNV